MDITNIIESIESTAEWRRGKAEGDRMSQMQYLPNWAQNNIITDTRWA
jgi:hypothetical protein